MSTERLQKILAQAGVASRRAAEELIVNGKVRVNGRIIRELGTRANLARDRVEVNGRRLVAEKPVYYLLHKPRGVVTTLDDPEGRPTVKDLLRDVPERVFPVGRLDFHTSGVLLLTNDGALAQALLHPKRAVPKTYTAKLQGQLDQAQLDHLRAGVVLDDGEKTAPAEVCLVRSDGKHTALEITIAEGKNRQIHRMGEAIGCPVLRLTRVSFAGLTLERLQVGKKRTLTPRELGELKQRYLHADEGPRGRGAPFFAATTETADIEVAHPTRPRRPKREFKGRDDRGERVVRAAAGAERSRRTDDNVRRGPVRVQVDRDAGPDARRRDAGSDAGSDAPRRGFQRQAVNASEEARRVSSNPYSKPRQDSNTRSSTQNTYSKPRHGADAADTRRTGGNAYARPRRGVNPQADPRRGAGTEDARRTGGSTYARSQQPRRGTGAEDTRRTGGNAYAQPRRGVNSKADPRRSAGTEDTRRTRGDAYAQPRRGANPKVDPRRGAGSEEPRRDGSSTYAQSQPRRGVNPKADPRRVSGAQDARRTVGNAYGSSRRNVNGTDESRRADGARSTPSRRVGPTEDPRRTVDRTAPKRGRDSRESLRSANTQRAGRKHGK